jgi:hypothetical protein
MSRFLSGDRVLMVASAVWLTAVIRAAALHPSVMAFGGTALFIAANAFVSFRTLTRKREVLIGLNCVQIALFGMLNYQLYCAFGSSHYQCDREPQYYDWIEFTAAHVLRAADVLDALDEYGIPIQNITHHSIAAGLLIVGMHLTVDVFLIGLILRWASRYWRDCAHETYLARGRREFGWLLASLSVYGLFAILQQLRPSDWVLWPLDNLLRLLDVGDMFQVFGWRLHGVEANFWTSGAAVLFRLAAGIWVARLVCWIRLIVFRTWGLSIAELTELLDDPDSDVRRGAAVGLGQSGRVASSAASALIEALHDLNRDVRTEAARALGRIGPAASDAVPRLIDALWLGHREQRLAAAEALGRIGPDARSAVFSLVSHLKVCDDQTRQAVMAALWQIAPDIAERLPMHKPAKTKRRKRFGRRARV